MLHKLHVETKTKKNTAVEKKTTVVFFMYFTYNITYKGDGNDV